jgi:hypothetical protein
MKKLLLLMIAFLMAINSQAPLLKTFPMTGYALSAV